MADRTLDYRNTNSLWGSVLVEVLFRLGVRQAVVAPGSRSAPLAFALAEDTGHADGSPWDEEKVLERYELIYEAGLVDAVELACKPTGRLDEPTRGIDVGAKLEVYELVNRLTAEGKAVVLVSSELPELMGMSDRILMLHDGEVGGIFSKNEATQEVLLHAAMGRNPATA